MADSRNSSLSKRLSSAGYVQTNLIRLNERHLSWAFSGAMSLHCLTDWHQCQRKHCSYGMKSHVSDMFEDV